VSAADSLWPPLNHHVLPPLAAAVAAGVLVPMLLSRARWCFQAPRFGVLAWCGLAGIFTFSAAVALVQLLMPSGSSHWLPALLAACLPGTGAPWPELADMARLSAAEAGALAAGGAVLLVPSVAWVRALLRARRRRADHMELLRLTGTRSARLGATVLEHEVPVVYCLPGRAPQVVLSSGAVKALTEEQLVAVLAHERAHIAGRHHLLVALAEACGSVFRWLPLGTSVRREVRLLLEMAADDHAMRRCSRDALATALYVMAAGQTPRATFAAGGASALLRVRRILSSQPTGRPVLRGLGVVTAAVVAFVPLVAACCSIYG
jgi:Zn-dependent protease with chaperone function